MRVSLAFLVVALLVPGLPGAGAKESCEHVRTAQVSVFAWRVDYADVKCQYYDALLDAAVTERIERYDGFAPGEEDPREPHAFTYYEQALERRFSDGRTTFLHRTLVIVGGALLQHDYQESRDAAGRATCWGAAKLVPGVVPGQASVPATPGYPTCLPPGLLA